MEKAITVTEYSSLDLSSLNDQLHAGWEVKFVTPFAGDSGAKGSVLVILTDARVGK